MRNLRVVVLLKHHYPTYEARPFGDRLTLYELATTQVGHCALELNPNSMEVHKLLWAGPLRDEPWDEGLAEADQTIAQHRKTAELDPNFFYNDSSGAVAYREKG